jgi:hypothetical protein
LFDSDGLHIPEKIRYAGGVSEQVRDSNVCPFSRTVFYEVAQSVLQFQFALLLKLTYESIFAERD